MARGGYQKTVSTGTWREVDIKKIMIAKHNTADVSPGLSAAARALRTAAFVTLLAVMTARPFISELGFRVSSLSFQSFSPAMGDGEEPLPPIDRMEAARVTFAVVILSAVALWLIGGAISGGTIIHHAWLVWPILAFVVLSFFSAMGASDKRAGWTGWLEQVSLISACWLAMQLCASRDGKKRFAVLVVLLVALGVTLAGKGLWQYFVEIPENIAFFEDNPAGGVGPTGAPPGSPAARLFEARVRSASPTGYIALSNVFASTLLVTLGAAIGLAAEKLSTALRVRRAWSQKRKKGEVHAPTLAAAITVAIVAAIPVTLALTGSRGALGGAAIASAGAIIAYLARRRLARRWRRTAIAAGLVFVLLLAGVVGFAMIHDRLPTKTMTFRWYYWSASARIVRSRPLLGVGPGNFPAYYLMHRRASAEEEVKTPHNFIVHALVQYGVAGGACYLLLLACVVIGACRPGQGDKTHPRAPPGRLGLWMLLVPAAAIAAARATLTVFGASGGGLLLEVTIPAAFFAIAAGLVLWSGERLRDGLLAPGAPVRVALAGGLVAFILHNLVTFTLWTPAAAMLFWVTAGACMGSAGAGRRRLAGLTRWTIAIVAAAAVVTAAIVFCPPLWRRSVHTESALRQLQRRPPQVGAAARLMELASRDDPLDAIAAGDAAKLVLQTAMLEARSDLDAILSRADALAEEAIERDPLRSSSWLLRGRINWYRINPEMMKPGRHGTSASGAAVAILDPSWLLPMRRAIELNPMALRMRLELARKLCDSGAAAECLEQLRRAERIDGSLLPESVKRFTASELAEIARLRARAKAMTTRKRKPTAPVRDGT